MGGRGRDGRVSTNMSSLSVYHTDEELQNRCQFSGQKVTLSPVSCSREKVERKPDQPAT